MALLLKNLPCPSTLPRPPQGANIQDHRPSHFPPPLRFKVVYVLSGKVQVTVNRATFLMTSGCHFYIPKGMLTRIINDAQQCNSS